MIALSEKPVYRFGEVEVDSPRALLRRGGVEIPLRQQTFQVLLYLLERRGRLVTKEELADSVWRGAAVTDNALVQCVAEIRRALDDDPRRPRFVKTFPKAGYRFIGDVREAYPADAGTVEIEEVTAVQLEFEKEISGGRADSLLTAPPSAARRQSVALICAGVVVLAAGFVAVYFGKSFRHSDRPPADVVIPPVSGKKPLAVMFFEKQSGGAELDWLREGLADMLITDLSRSKNLAVLSRRQLQLLLERGGHTPGGPLRLDDAMEVARRSQADVVLLGGFAGVNEKIRIDVQLHDARTGQFLAAEGLVADSLDHVLTQIDLLSLKVAAHLGSGPGRQDAAAGLAQVMTSNLEAYRYYSLALEKAQALHSKEAIALLEKAAALDPQFAMAHARTGYVHAVIWGHTDEAKPHLEKAFRLSSRLTEKDRLLINAWYATANLDFDGAIKSFREIIASYPSDVEAYLSLGRLLTGERRYEEAVDVYKQALTLDAESGDLYNALGQVYSFLNRHEEAIAMHRRYVQLAPNEPNAHDSLGLSYQWAGRYGEATEEYQRALRLNSDFEVALIHLGNTYFQTGHYREALSCYQRYIQIAPSDTERARGYTAVSLLHLHRGELDQAERAAQKSATYSGADASARIHLALARDDLKRAERLVEQYENSLPAGRGTRGAMRYVYYFKGLLDLRRGRDQQALENFREALRQAPLVWNLDSLEDCLGGAYLKLGRPDEAIAEYERILRLNPNYPLALYRLAQAYERKGQTDKARNLYERFLQVWKDADADLPQVIAARGGLSR